MPRKKKCKVFVSYSRHDEALVRPLAGLLGAAAEQAVFLDVNSLRPGDFWKTGIETAVRDCSVFILCWCCDSAQSEFVKHEIDLALEGSEKNLVPVLFCSVPLPSSLADRQWVDLRGRVVHSCSHTVAETLIVSGDGAEVNVGHPAPSIHQSRSWVMGLSILAVFLLCTGLAWLAIRPTMLGVHHQPTPNSAASTVCLFQRGPLKGTMVDYAPQPALPVGSPCNDGRGSSGIVIAPFPLAEAPLRSLWWILIVTLLAAIGLSLICVKSWMRARKRRPSEASTVAAIATAYFQNLGKRQL